MKILFSLLLLVSTLAGAAEFDSVSIDNTLNLQFATPSSVAIINSSGFLVSSPVSSITLGFVGNLTSDAQAQINALNAALGAYLPLAGGTMSGHINFGGLTANNAADPTLTGDLATKHYVDVQVSGVTPTWGTITGTLSNQTDLQSALVSKLTLTGGTMSGHLNFGGLTANNAADPTLTGDLATKHYVDVQVAGVTPTWGSITGTLSNQTDLQSALASKLTLTGGTMSGHIDFGGLTANNAADPTLTGDLATKHYVDVQVAGASPVWGSITGLLSNQTDLQTALSSKLPLTGGTMAGNIDMGNNVLSDVNALDVLNINAFSTLSALNIIGANSNAEITLQPSGQIAVTATSVDVGGVNVTSVADPASPQDAATKNYVDTHTGNAADKALDNLTTTAINQDLLAPDMAQNLGGPLNRWNTIYVANLENDGVNGITVAHGFDMGGSFVTSLAAPVATTDAANKAYVDAAVAGSTPTTGNLTTTTTGVSLTGNTGAVIGTGTTIDIQNATALQPGLLTSADWNTFNGKGVGTVTAVSVASANGFAGSSSGGATPALTLTTSVTGVIKGNGTALSAATSGSDYSAGTAGLSTGILKSTTATGALTIAVAGDFPTLNQNTSGNAATVTTNANLTGPITSAGNATSIASQTGTGTKFVMDTSPTLVTPNLGTPSAMVGTNLTGTGASFTAGIATNLSGGYLAPVLTATAKTTTYAMLSTDFAIKVNPGANFNVTMPDPVANANHIYSITNIATGTFVVSVLPNASETFGVSALTAIHLSTPGESWVLQSDGTNWQIKTHYCATAIASYTPVITGTGSNPTVGTTTANTVRWSRAGNMLQMNYAFLQTAAGSGGAGTFLWSLPTGLTIDTTQAPASTTVGLNNWGNGWVFQSSQSGEGVSVQVYNSTHLALESAGGGTFITSGFISFGSAAAIFEIKFTAMVPIANWEP